MKNILRLILFIVLFKVMPIAAQEWHQDVLGEEFKVKYFTHQQGGEPIISSLITLSDSIKCDAAVLYVHGFNDYFFQKELAYKFRENGYSFYAVDLRKYGRSLQPNQKKCQVRDFKEYIPDIDSALNVIKSAGYDKIALMGHSTGGLVSAFYLMNVPSAPVDALILNSPFLDWNLGKLEYFVNLASFIGAVFPNIGMASGSGTAYGESLHRDFHGEWTFDVNWKSIDPIKVDLGWVRAINSAQHYLRKKKHSISIPILLMYSSRTIDAVDWSPEVHKADVVLDVEDIKKYGSMLGYEVSKRQVKGGMHDLILSAPDVRYKLYESIFNWLDWKF